MGLRVKRRTYALVEVLIAMALLAIVSTPMLSTYIYIVTIEQQEIAQLERRLLFPLAIYEMQKDSFWSQYTWNDVRTLNSSSTLDGTIGTFISEIDMGNPKTFTITYSLSKDQASSNAWKALMIGDVHIEEGGVSYTFSHFFIAREVQN